MALIEIQCQNLGVIGRIEGEVKGCAAKKCAEFENPASRDNSSCGDDQEHLQHTDTSLAPPRRDLDVSDSVRRPAFDQRKQLIGTDLVYQPASITNRVF